MGGGGEWRKRTAEVDQAGGTGRRNRKLEHRLGGWSSLMVEEDGGRGWEKRIIGMIGE